MLGVFVSDLKHTLRLQEIVSRSKHSIFVWNCLYIKELMHESIIERDKVRHMSCKYAAMFIQTSIA